MSDVQKLKDAKGVGVTKGSTTAKRKVKANADGMPHLRGAQSVDKRDEMLKHNCKGDCKM